MNDLKSSLQSFQDAVNITDKLISKFGNDYDIINNYRFDYLLTNSTKKQYMDLYFNYNFLLISLWSENEIILNLNRIKSKSLLHHIVIKHKLLKKFKDHKIDELISLDNIKKLLRIGDVLIEYLITSHGLLTFIIKRDLFKIYNVPFSYKEIEKYIYLIRRYSENKNKFNIDILAILHSLYNLLIKPIEQFLVNQDNIIIVPHNLLHFIPFGALFDGGRFMIEKDFTLSYQISSGIYYVLNSLKRKRMTSCLSVASKGTKIMPLHFSEDGAKEIARLYSPHSKFLSTDENALMTLNKYFNQKYDIIHLIGHHFEMGYLSDLNLCSENNKNIKLSFNNIAGLNLNATLVSFPNCQSALGSITLADEIINLYRAFFMAGAKSVLASLWNVSDHIGSIFSRYFFVNLKEHSLSKSMALKKAQLSLKEEYEDPSIWAPFILVGESR